MLDYPENVCPNNFPYCRRWKRSERKRQLSTSGLPGQEVPTPSALCVARYSLNDDPAASTPCPRTSDHGNNESAPVIGLTAVAPCASFSHAVDPLEKIIRSPDFLLPIVSSKFLRIDHRRSFARLCSLQIVTETNDPRSAASRNARLNCFYLIKYRAPLW